jgi:hypothetical protein
VMDGFQELPIVMMKWLVGIWSQAEAIPKS